MSIAPEVAAKDRLKGLAAERETLHAERSLAAFTKQAWPIVEPDTPLSWNWHLDMICDHLEAVLVTERIKNLLINIPPGCMKSLLLVMANAWIWQKKPWLRWLATSYGDNLTTRDNVKVRQIVESEWYQRRWGKKVRLADDQNQKTRFNTTRRGYRIGVPLKGGVTGEHPHVKTVDDPHNTKKALSAVERKADLDAFQQGLSARGAALRAATIVEMQRLNQGDLSGYLLDNQPGRWVHICLPMRYELPTMVDGVLTPRMPMTPLGWTDRRTEPGELLWPELFPEDTVRDLEVTLTPYGAAGQLQQRPTPEKGGLFEREWFSKIVDVPPNLADVKVIGRGWDMAGTEGGGDWTVGVLMAITNDGRIYILDVVRVQIGPGEDERHLKAVTSMDAASYGRRVRIFEEQEGGSAGKKVTRSHALLLQGYDYTAESSTGDKATRARPFAAQAKVGNVYIVKAPWNKAYVDELVLFPNGLNDDQVDGTSGIFNHLTQDAKPVIKKRKVTGF